MTYANTRYSVGTCTVTNGSATVSFAGGAVINTVAVPGDRFHAPDGRIYWVDAVHETLQQVTLHRTYIGSTQSGQAYVLEFGANHYSAQVMAGNVSDLLQTIRASAMVKALQPGDLSGGNPLSGVGFDGDLGYVAGPPAQMWGKISGTWTELTARLGRAPVANGNADKAMTILDHERVQIFRLTTTNRTCTLPEISSVFAGYVAAICMDITTSATLTVTRAGTDTFGDGATSKVLTGAGGFLLVFAGADNRWHVISFLPAPLGSAAYQTDETGSWTPTLTFQTPGDLSVSYTQQVGAYSRIGRLVTAAFRVAGTMTHSTASGQFRIGGFPFTARGGFQNYLGGVRLNSAAIDWSGTNRTIALAKLTSNTEANLAVSGPMYSGALISPGNIASGNAPDIFGSVTYEAA